MVADKAANSSKRASTHSAALGSQGIISHPIAVMRQLRQSPADTNRASPDPPESRRRGPRAEGVRSYGSDDDGGEASASHGSRCGINGMKRKDDSNLHQTTMNGGDGVLRGLCMDYNDDGDVNGDGVLAYVSRQSSDADSFRQEPGGGVGGGEDGVRGLESLDRDGDSAFASSTASGRLGQGHGGRGSRGMDDDLKTLTNEGMRGSADENRVGQHLRLTTEKEGLVVCGEQVFGTKDDERSAHIWHGESDDGEMELIIRGAHERAKILRRQGEGERDPRESALDNNLTQGTMTSGVENGPRTRPVVFRRHVLADRTDQAAAPAHTRASTTHDPAAHLPSPSPKLAAWRARKGLGPVEGGLTVADSDPDGNKSACRHGFALRAEDIISESSATLAGSVPLESRRNQATRSADLNEASPAQTHIEKKHADGVRSSEDEEDAWRKSSTGEGMHGMERKDGDHSEAALHQPGGRKERRGMQEADGRRSPMEEGLMGDGMHGMDINDDGDVNGDGVPAYVSRQSSDADSFRQEPGGSVGGWEDGVRGLESLDRDGDSAFASSTASGRLGQGHGGRGSRGMDDDLKTLTNEGMRGSADENRVGQHLRLTTEKEGLVVCGEQVFGTKDDERSAHIWHGESDDGEMELIIRGAHERAKILRRQGEGERDPRESALDNNLTQGTMTSGVENGPRTRPVEEGSIGVEGVRGGPMLNNSELSNACEQGGMQEEGMRAGAGSNFAGRQEPSDDSMNEKRGFSQRTKAQLAGEEMLTRN